MPLQGIVQLALFALQLHSQDIKISCIYHSRRRITKKQAIHLLTQILEALNFRSKRNMYSNWKMILSHLRVKKIDWPNSISWKFLGISLLTWKSLLFRPIVRAHTLALQIHNEFTVDVIYAFYEDSLITFTMFIYLSIQ